jgi:NADPH-dependent 2,4-dienoyl-CoA reductase/sulfur reductase-like enzyme/peroxiredoxin family protein/TusA-related sulfurtransferase/rhodanese-related sulfurtransferase
MIRKKIVIIGGVAGGASAAARARRLNEQAEILLIERGPDISFANCGLPYHIGGTIDERAHLLVTTPEIMKSKFNIRVQTLTEALSINPATKTVTLRDLTSGESCEEAYDALILSPGAAPIRPKIPGINHPSVLTLRNMVDMDRIIQAIEGKKRVAIIGGGYIGLEMAEALRERKKETILIELAPQVMGPADPEMVAPIHQELAIYGVDLRLNTSVTSFTPDGDERLCLGLSNGDQLHVDLAILAIGVKPETALAESAQLKLGTTGGIKVNAQMQTSDPSIYAIGDAIEVIDHSTQAPALIPLAGPANRQGRIAADHIFGRDSSYKNTQGTAICKVFNLAIGMTGLNEKTAKRNNIAYEKIYVHPASHATYYPGAHPISLKMLFDPTTGKILGAQAVGADGIDKRIDVLAVAIRAGLTVYDLEEMELSYAPPFGSAKDVINYAGFTAANILRGDATYFHVPEADAPTEMQQLLDVRTPDELLGGTIPGARNIPLNTLRDELQQLSKEREYLVFCQVGLRGYLACRILSQNGYRCKNLIGGYKTYRMFHPEPSTSMPEYETIHNDSGDDTVTYPNSSKEGEIAKTINACGQQCPGPILQLKQALDEIEVGEAVEISATDPGFCADIPAWCNATGHQLNRLDRSDSGYTAVITKQTARTDTPHLPSAGKKRFTNVVFSNDLDRAIAAFIIANGAASMGYEVTLFFTFWGLNILRKEGAITVKKTPIEKMFGIMMPKGPNKLKLSQMQMGGLGAAMIKGIMKKKQVLPLPELIETAIASGVKIVACTMSMDLMGIKREELINGVEEGGVAMYIDHLGDNANLFI